MKNYLWIIPAGIAALCVMFWPLIRKDSSQPDQILWESVEKEETDSMKRVQEPALTFSSHSEDLDSLCAEIMSEIEEAWKNGDYEDLFLHLNSDYMVTHGYDMMEEDFERWMEEKKASYPDGWKLFVYVRQETLMSGGTPILCRVTKLRDDTTEVTYDAYEYESITFTLYDIASDEYRFLPCAEPLLDEEMRRLEDNATDTELPSKEVSIQKTGDYLLLSYR